MVVVRVVMRVVAAALEGCFLALRPFLVQRWLSLLEVVGQEVAFKVRTEEVVPSALVPRQEAVVAGRHQVEMVGQVVVTVALVQPQRVLLGRATMVGPQ